MMKNLLFVLLTLSSLLTLRAKDYEIRGPQGGIASIVTLPEGFDHARTARAIQSRSSEGWMGLGRGVRTSAESFTMILAKTVSS